MPAQPLLTGLRRAATFTRAVAALVVLTFTTAILSPTALAARNAPPRTEPPATTTEAKLSRTVVELSRLLRRDAATLTAQREDATERSDLERLRHDLQRLDAAAREAFDRIDKRLRAHPLPAVIQQRQREAVARYGQEMDTLLRHLTALQKAATPAERLAHLAETRRFLDGHQLRPTPQRDDPNRPAFRGLRPQPGQLPKSTPQEFLQAGLTDSPPLRLAAAEGYRLDGLPGAADPAYLAATPEVTLSAAIRAKAAELGNEPVQIYQWVRNHVQWLPTWGGFQDADQTLGSRQGNAFDIASLLIALLRAAGYPARYVHGTVELTEAQFRNWAGGFSDIDAATDFAAAGGIPITVVSSGGKITKVRMEHLWVEAALDFAPSRGAINRAADTWVPLDASYKRYDYPPGLDTAAIAGIDGAALAEQFVGSGTVNAAEGWVQGLDPAILQSAQSQAVQRLESYLAQNLPNATVGDVIGGRRIVERHSPLLSDTLPLKQVVRGASYDTLPDALRAQLAFELGEGHEVTQPWAKLNNHKVTLSFRLASAADEAALRALLPEGEITDLSQLPASLPGYLLQVVPELKVDGTTLLSGAPLALGGELPFTYRVTMPVHGTRSYTNPVIAGSYLAVGVVGGSVSVDALAGVKGRLEQTRAALQGQDPADRKSVV